MPRTPIHRWPRGPWNGLHQAALHGSTERLEAQLSDGGSIDIDQGDPYGRTPLTMASRYGHLDIVRILLDKGANVSIAADGGATALHAGGGWHRPGSGQHDQRQHAASHSCKVWASGAFECADRGRRESQQPPLRWINTAFHGGSCRTQGSCPDAASCQGEPTADQ